MNRNEALRILAEISEANEEAAKTVEQARVLSGRQQGKVDEAAWIQGIKEGKTPVYDGDFFVMNTDRSTN